MTDFVAVNALQDLILIKPRRFVDDRGYFSETYNQAAYQENGITCDFVQDNHSLSQNVGTLRGFHFQTPPYAQDKLVRCTRGKILDFAVDIRHGSPEFGTVTRVELSEENGHQFFVPAGYAHAFYTLEENTEVQYKVSSLYHKKSEGGLAFDDPALDIEYPIGIQEIVLSEKDRLFPKLADLPKHFIY